MNKESHPFYNSKNLPPLVNEPGEINTIDTRENYTFEELWQELLKERKRVMQWRILSEASAILNFQLHTESLPLKFIKCAKRLVFAEEAMLALKEEEKPELKIVKHYSSLHGEYEDKLIEEKAQEAKGAIKIILETGKTINRDSSHFPSQDLYGFSSIKANLLGVPLYASGKVIGALLMANKRKEKSFTQDDQDLLIILGTQLGIALENSRLYEKTDEKLQVKVNELEQTNKVLFEQHKILSKTQEIHKELTELALRGEGIKAICETLTSIIGSPVQVEDHTFNVKASTFEGSITYLSSKDLMERRDYRNQIRQVFQERTPVEFSLDKSTTQYLVPIVAGHQVLGTITTVKTEKSLNQLDKKAMEQGATIIALEMLKKRAAAEHSLRLKENFLEHVLERNIENEEWVHHRALQLGFDVNFPYQLLTVEIESGRNDKSRVELYQHIRELCLENFTNTIVVMKPKHAVIFTSIDAINENSKVKELTDFLITHLQDAVKEGTWWIALGTSCNKLRDYAVSYRKAAKTLEIMKALRIEKTAASNESLGIFSLIEINPQGFTEFIQKTLGALADYDKKHKTQLIDTLKLYYRYNGNVLKAAREGYLNPSTMKYRLRRIKDITGFDLKDSDVNLQLQFALKLMDLENSGT